VVRSRIAALATRFSASTHHNLAKVTTAKARARVSTGQQSHVDHSLYHCAILHLAGVREALREQPCSTKKRRQFVELVGPRNSLVLRALLRRICCDRRSASTLHRWARRRQVPRAARSRAANVSAIHRYTSALSSKTRIISPASPATGLSTCSGRRMQKLQRERILRIALSDTAAQSRPLRNCSLALDMEARAAAQNKTSSR
jgi:hypothetical protein